MTAIRQNEVAPLVKALSDASSERRATAARELARLGPVARTAAVALVRTASDRSEDVREWVTAALEELGVPAISDVDALATALDNPHSNVGYWAATLLGRAEEAAGSAVAELAAAVARSPSLSVRQRAAWALGRIGPSAVKALDVLERATSDPDERLARLAREAARRIRD